MLLLCIKETDSPRENNALRCTGTVGYAVISGFMWSFVYIFIHVYIQYDKDYSDWVLDPINRSDLTLLFGLNVVVVTD